MATAAAATGFSAASAFWFWRIDERVKFDAVQTVAFSDVRDERASIRVRIAQEVEHGGLSVEQDFAVDDRQVDA